MKTAKTHEPLDAKLTKLREREAALKEQAQQLQARAEHLNRVGRGHLERLARRVDAHEKIVLGALVKKAGLDVCRVEGVTSLKQQRNDVVLSSFGSKAEDKPAALGSTPSKQHPNADETTSFECRLDDQAIDYDRELILGGLLWLASVLTAQPGGVVTVPPHEGLREAGRLAGANVPDKTTRRARS